MLEADPKRDEKGRFGANNIANPKGRGKGTRNKSSMIYDFITPEDEKKFWESIVKKATGTEDIEQDMRAAQIIADRMKPKLNAVSVYDEEIEELNTLKETLNAIIDKLGGHREQPQDSE